MSLFESLRLLILNYNIFDPFLEDFVKKVDPPKAKRVGRNRVFYTFVEENENLELD